MKKSLLLAAITIISFAIKAEVFTVEVGGNQSVTPYYEPQFITINVGDTIIWDFVLGTHNVTTTSGPESIDSGDLQSPNTFMHVFTMAGIYDYECTLFSHADTQFGTVTVVAPDGIEETSKVDILIYPNPAAEFIRIEVEEDNAIKSVSMFNSAGVELTNLLWNKEDNSIELVDISNGIYIVSISTLNGIIRKSIKVER